MAVEFDIKAQRTSEYGFLPEHLDVQPEMNGRHELPDISALVDSIITHGQLQPVTIRKTAGQPVLVAGFSRWRAVSHINAKGLTPKPLTIRCSYTQLTEQQAFLANIEENRVRNATTEMDDAYNIQRLVNVYRLTEQQAADAYRMSLSWIKGRLSLLELTPEAEQAVRQGRVKGTAATAIAKLSREQQKKLVSGEGKVTASDVRAVTSAEKPQAKPQASQANSALRDAIRAILGECDAQPDVMVYEIHKDNILALRAAMGEK